MKRISMTLNEEELTLLEAGAIVEADSLSNYVKRCAIRFIAAPAEPVGNGAPEHQANDHADDANTFTPPIDDAKRYRLTPHQNSRFEQIAQSQGKTLPQVIEDVLRSLEDDEE